MIGGIVSKAKSAAGSAMQAHRERASAGIIPQSKGIISGFKERMIEYWTDPVMVGATAGGAVIAVPVSMWADHMLDTGFDVGYKWGGWRKGRIPILNWELPYPALEDRKFTLIPKIRGKPADELKRSLIAGAIGSGASGAVASVVYSKVDRDIGKAMAIGAGLNLLGWTIRGGVLWARAEGQLAVKHAMSYLQKLFEYKEQNVQQRLNRALIEHAKIMAQRAKWGKLDGGKVSVMEKRAIALKNTIDKMNAHLDTMIANVNKGKYEKEGHPTDAGTALDILDTRIRDISQKEDDLIELQEQISGKQAEISEAQQAIEAEIAMLKKDKKVIASEKAKALAAERAQLTSKKGRTPKEAITATKKYNYPPPKAKEAPKKAINTRQIKTGQPWTNAAGVTVLVLKNAATGKYIPGIRAPPNLGNANIEFSTVVYPTIEAAADAAQNITAQEYSDRIAIFQQRISAGSAPTTQPPKSGTQWPNPAGIWVEIGLRSSNKMWIVKIARMPGDIKDMVKKAIGQDWIEVKQYKTQQEAFNKADSITADEFNDIVLAVKTKKTGKGGHPVLASLLYSGRERGGRIVWGRDVAHPFLVDQRDPFQQDDGSDDTDWDSLRLV